MREGDIVTIQATVIRPATGSGSLGETHCVRPLGHYADIYVDPDKVTMLTPFFKNGERVRKVRDSKVTGTVIALHDGDVWVALDKGTRGTIPATELEVLDA